MLTKGIKLKANAWRKQCPACISELSLFFFKSLLNSHVAVANKNSNNKQNKTDNNNNNNNKSKKR